MRDGCRLVRDGQTDEQLVDAATMMRRQRRRRTRDVCRPLRHWLYGHRDAPYPSRSDKLQLAAVTELSLTQVCQRHVTQCFVASPYEMPSPEMYFCGGSLSFPFPSFHFPSLFPASNYPSKSNPAKGFEGSLLSAATGENDICSHQTRSLGSKYTEIRLQPSIMICHFGEI